MTIEQLHSQNRILLEAVSGSNAYGLATPASDVDLRGIFVMPEDDFLGMSTLEQVNDAKNDEVYYEIGRFFQLLVKSNPTIMELLAMPKDCIRISNPLLDQIPLKAVLSKECRFSFAGYARAQLKKAHGLNKKVLNPMDQKRKSILEFCFVLEGNGTIPVKKWLNEHSWEQKNCGLVNLAHGQGLYALFHAGEKAIELGFKGIAKKDTSNNVSLTSVPKNMPVAAYMTFNLDGYIRYCKDYKNYWEWVEKRNETRYENTIRHGKNYDAKNMMHTFRLLDMAEEIAVHQELRVRRPNRDFLMKVRGGEFMYQELLKLAEEKVEKIDNLFESSGLPDKPDADLLNTVLINIRKAIYGRGRRP